MFDISKLNKITGVAKGGTASIGLPVNATYEKLHFKIAGCTPADLQNIRLDLNGDMLCEYDSLQDIVDENSYFERDQVNGLVTWHFARPEVKSPINADLSTQRFFALGTTGLSTVQIKFDIDRNAKNPADENEALDVSVFTEKDIGTVPGWLFKRRSFRYSFSQGINEVADIPKPVGAFISMIEIKKAGVKSSEFLVDNVKWREHVPKDLHNHILEQRGRTAIQDVHSIDLAMSGDVFSALKITENIFDMRLRIDCETAGAAEVIVHYFADYASTSF
ncbi:major capsid protein P2 [Pseudoalteromonas aurantia]|uniref:Capsid protein n=1 Tax=Pseudoalteromonas aurantia TaxID=43654 RepID=A0A5S3UYK9_9GAMM|nr:major capsid protein P2 [Pseudoalteromonas aurantia]TMO62859.1 capsid protein [Pseudoalteromonas aurantia]